MVLPTIMDGRLNVMVLPTIMVGWSYVAAAYVDDCDPHDWRSGPCLDQQASYSTMTMLRGVYDLLVLGGHQQKHAAVQKYQIHGSKNIIFSSSKLYNYDCEWPFWLDVKDLPGSTGIVFNDDNVERVHVSFRWPPTETSHCAKIFNFVFANRGLQCMWPPMLH